MTERELHTHLPEIINTMNDGLFCTRTDGTIMLVNDALTRITGFSREELMDRTCAVLGCDACDRSRAEGETHHCRLFLKRVENRKNCHIRCKDGTLRHVLKNASLLRAPGGEIIGAVETVTDITELDVKERRIRELSLTLDQDTDFHGMVGRSTAMRAVYNLLEKAARTEAPVLILGESGTGKELAARAIHELGPHRDGPYVQVNCAALNESLLESELFGHAKGAFTGAIRHRLGRFEEAGGRGPVPGRNRGRAAERAGEAPARAGGPGASSAWATVAPCRFRPGSSAPPTRTCPPWWLPGASGRISTTG